MPTHRNQSRSLPPKASEEYLRKEAKRFSRLHGINLVAAQRALAREYGHRNWADLINAAKIVLQPAAGSNPSSTKAPGGSEIPSLRDEQWSAILNLAEESLAEMQVAPGVKEWFDNRKAFPASGGIQQQLVATLDNQIVGYACAEHPPAWMRNKSAAGEYRLFMVVEPSARGSLGNRLLAKLRESLIALGARRAWFQEYEADAGLVSFLETKGFVKRITFRTDDGTGIIRLSMDAPFKPLMLQSAGTIDPQSAPHEEKPR